ncbi:hypothetical protein ACP3P6_04880 [Enterobacter mori]
MAAKNSMPERAIAQTENADLEIQQENSEKLRKKSIRALHDEPLPLRICTKEERRVLLALSFIPEWSATIFRYPVSG